MNPIPPKLNFWSKIIPFYKTAPTPVTIYLPTTLYSTLNAISKTLPNSYLFMADFNELPSDASLPGIYSPIVASKSLDGKDYDHSSYLIEVGNADIFFPTDFDLLSKMYKKVCDKDSNTISHKEFVLKYCSHEETSCRNGDNPMVDDYSNMSAFMTLPKF